MVVRRPRRHVTRQRAPWALLLTVVALATAVPVAREARTQELVSVASGEVDYYCSLSLYLEGLANTSPDFERNSNAEQFRIAKELATEALPLVRSIRNAAPDAAVADVDDVIDGVEQVARDGDFRILGLRGGESVQAERDLSPLAVRVRAALQGLHDHNTRHCGWRPQPVGGTEMAFPGVPATLPTGLTSLEFRNDGEEIHQLLLVRTADGARAPLPEILDRIDRSDEPDERLVDSDEVTYLGQAFAPPDKSDHLVADLQPGEYAMVCFIPVGSTFISELDESTGSGASHFRLGMAAYFTVTS